MSDLFTHGEARAQSVADSEDLQFFSAWDERVEPQLEFPDSMKANMIVASISPASPLSDRDQLRDFSIDDNSTTTIMAKPSSWFSLGREAPPLAPPILVEGDMSSTSSGKGPSNSPEVPTPDLIAYGIDELHLCLYTAAQCLVRVQKMPSRKFNNEQCGYLVAKLIAVLEKANLFLGPNSTAEPEEKRRTSEDMTRCVEAFKLFLALALKIESFIKGCCKDEWLQAAMTLTNTAEYVSSLGFNLELCRVSFSMEWRAATKALTAAQVDNMDREELKVVRRKASLDVDVLLDKVILKLPSFQGEDKDLAIYLLQRLKSVTTSLSPESPFWSAFDDLGFIGRIFQMVRPTELLGKGTSATVHKALWLGTPVAKKTFYGLEHPDYVRKLKSSEDCVIPTSCRCFVAQWTSASVPS